MPETTKLSTIQNPIGMVFCEIPAGSFMMGSPEDEVGRYSDEGPQHLVTFDKPFWMQETAVTREQWISVMGNDPSHFQDGELTRPVENVSWDDCQHFIAKLNAMEGTDTYRLPSEAEWEYACRAGTTGLFNFGEISPKKANYTLPYSAERPVPVKSYPPNAWGLHEMHGNVWEWCQDVWHENYDSAPTNGSAWESGGEQGYRSYRGGGWHNISAYLFSASRFGSQQEFRHYGVGFRLAMTAP